jgi:hypothetical protein
MRCIETLGCGATFLDFGWLDILLLTGTRWEDSPPGAITRLYKNNRDGTFSEVTATAGLTCAGWLYGVTVGDYNNDGFEDIFITGWPRNFLFRNNGDGTFTDVTGEAGLLHPAARWSTGCCFVGPRPFGARRPRAFRTCCTPALPVGTTTPIARRCGRSCLPKRRKNRP